MITLKLSGAVKGLDGEPIIDDQKKPLQSNHVIADSLGRAAQGDAFKLYDLAQRVWNSPDGFECDQADYDLIYSTLEKAAVIPLVKVPILRSLKEQFENSKREARAVPAPMLAEAEEPPTVEEAENRRRLKR